MSTRNQCLVRLDTFGVGRKRKFSWATFSFLPEKKFPFKVGTVTIFWLIPLNSHAHESTQNETDFVGPKAMCVRMYIFVLVSVFELIKLIWWRKSTVSFVCFAHRWAYEHSCETFYKFIRFNSGVKEREDEDAKTEAIERTGKKVWQTFSAGHSARAHTICFLSVATWLCVQVCMNKHTVKQIRHSQLCMFYSFQMLYMSNVLT